MTERDVAADDGPDAVLAFEALRAEVAALRQGVEALEPALREERGPTTARRLGSWQPAWRPSRRAWS